MRKIPGNCPKDDLCENCCCLPCACTISKVPVDVERMFTTVKQSKGVKQCLQSHKRSEGVKWFLQSDSECLPSEIRKHSHAFVQDDCIDVQRDIRQNSKQGCGDKFYHAPHVRISNSSKRSMKFNEDWTIKKNAESFWKLCDKGFV